MAKEIQEESVTPVAQIPRVKKNGIKKKPKKVIRIKAEDLS